MLSAIKNFRNHLNFALRNRIRISRPLPKNFSTSEMDRRLQSEVHHFLSGFNWEKILTPEKTRTLTCIDIGARNFFAAPVVDSLLRGFNCEPTIHGIELDAYRLLGGFHNRSDFGNYFAKQIPQGHFHAMNFLEWHHPIDCAFLLNPFVTVRPILAWGLPLKELRPEKIFHHCYKLLNQRNGVLILSSPSLDELDISKNMAHKVGFKILSKTEWHPNQLSIQSDSRFGLAFRVS